MGWTEVMRLPWSNIRRGAHAREEPRARTRRWCRSLRFFPGFALGRGSRRGGRATRPPLDPADLDGATETEEAARSLLAARLLPAGVWGLGLGVSCRSVVVVVGGGCSRARCLPAIRQTSKRQYPWTCRPTRALGLPG